MGYQEGRIEEAVFVVLAEDQPAALARLLEVSEDDFGYDLSDRDLRRLDDFLRLFAVRTVREGDDIVSLEFEDRMMLELDDVFRALAPFVQTGSRVRMHAGSGARWEFAYEGGSMTDRALEPRPWYGR